MKSKTSILFINLPYFIKDNEDKGKNTRSILVYPYGVLSIATYLKKKFESNIHINILDLNLYEKEQINEKVHTALMEYEPDIVGISMMFDFCYKYLDVVSKQIKEYNSKIIVLLGGDAATVSYKDIMKDQKYIDALCFGEGEYAMQDFLEAENIQDGLNNFVWVTKETVKKELAPVRTIVENIDEVIDIDYSLIDINKYGMREAFSPFSSVKTTKDIHQFIMITSRGCPFKCVFCAVHSFTGREMRYASVDALIKYVRYLVDKYQMNVLTIYDDQVLLNVPRAKEFFKRMAEFKIRIELPNGVSVAFIDEEMARLMKDAGVDTIPLAIEHGSVRVLKDIIHKPLKLEQVKPVVEWLHKYNIFVVAYFVIGLPGETEEDRDETVRFIKEVGVDWSQFNLAVPLRGSELYNICVKNNYINPNFAIGDRGMDDYVINIPGIDIEWIKKKRYLMNLECNFINNYRVRIKDYKTAKLCFEDVVIRYPEHAFAYWCLSYIYNIENRVDTNKYFEKILSIIKEQSTWKEYFNCFGIDTKLFFVTYRGENNV